MADGADVLIKLRPDGFVVVVFELEGAAVSSGTKLHSCLPLSMLEAKKYALGSLSTFESWLIYLGAGLSLIVIGFLLTRKRRHWPSPVPWAKPQRYWDPHLHHVRYRGAIFSLISGASH